MDPEVPPEDVDESNPYAPPLSTFVPELPRAPMGAIPFTVSDVFQAAWNIFRDRMGACMAVCWGVFALNWAINFALQLAPAAAIAISRQPAFGVAVGWLITLVGWVVLMWIGIGQSLALLKIARGQAVAAEDVFRGGPFLLTMIFAAILFALVIFVPAMLAAVVVGVGIAIGRTQPSGAAVALLAIIFGTIVVAALYLVCRLMMYYFLVIDRYAGALDSLRWSWELTHNRVWRILVLCVGLPILLNLAGMLACGFGLIFSIPLSSLMWPVTYLALVGWEKPGLKPAPEMWDADELL